MLSPQQRINLMTSNLNKSHDKLMRGEIKRDYYETMEKDVNKRMKEIKELEL